MTFEVDGNRLQISESQSVEFDHDICEVAEVGDGFIVLLDIPPGESMTENVFGVSSSCEILWQIQRIPETATDPVNSYTSILSNTGAMVELFNWNGTGVTIDARTGEVVDKWIGK